MNRIFRLILSLILVSTSNLTNLALAHADEANPRVETETPTLEENKQASPERLVSILVTDPPTEGVSTLFFNNNENRPNENAYYSKLIEETPTLRERAQEGAVFRNAWIQQLQADLETVDGRFIVSPYYESLVWIVALPKTNETKKDLPLTEETARREALYATVVRFQLRPDTSVDELEKQQHATPENQSAFQFYRRKYFSYLSAERAETVKVPPDVKMIKNELRVRALKARAENARAALRHFAELNHTQRINFEAESGSRQNRLISIPVRPMRTSFIPTENTFNRGSLTLLSRPWFFRRMLNGLGLRNAGAQDWRAAQPSYFRTQPESSNFKYGLEIKTTTGDFGISQANFWEFLQDTDKLNDHERGHNYFSEYAERDRILSSYLHFLDQVDDRNLDRLAERFRQAVTNSAQFARDGSISAQFLVFPRSARGGSAMSDMRWWGLKDNARHWEIRDEIARSSNGFITRKNRKKLNNQELPENRNAPTKAKIQKGVNRFLKRTAKALLYSLLGTFALHEVFNPNSLLRSTIGNEAESHYPSLYRRYSAQPIETQDLSNAANYNLGGGANGQGQKGPPMFKIEWGDDDRVNPTNFEFFALLTPQNERAIDKAEDYEVRDALVKFGIELDSDLAVKITTVANAYADKDGNIPIPSHDKYWPTDSELSTDNLKLIEGRDYQVRVIGTNGLFYFHLTNSGKKQYEKNAFHYNVEYHYHNGFSDDVDTAGNPSLADMSLSPSSVGEIGSELIAIGALRLGNDFISGATYSHRIYLFELVNSVRDDGLYSMSAYYGPKKDFPGDVFSPFSIFLKDDGQFHYQCTGSNILLKTMLVRYKALTPGADFHVENLQGLVYQDGDYLSPPGHLETVIFKSQHPFHRQLLDATPGARDNSSGQSQVTTAIDQAMDDIGNWKNKPSAQAKPAQKKTPTEIKKSMSTKQSLVAVGPIPNRNTDPVAPIALPGRPASPTQTTTQPESLLLNENVEYQIKTYRYPEAKARRDDNEIIAGIIASRDRLLNALKLYKAIPILSSPSTFKYAPGAELATIAQTTVDYISGEITSDKYWSALIVQQDRLSDSQVRMPSVQEYLATEIKNYQKDISLKQFEQRVVGAATNRFQERVQKIERLDPGELLKFSSAYVLSLDVQSAVNQLSSELSSTRLLERLNRTPSSGPMHKACVEVLNVRIGPRIR